MGTPRLPGGLLYAPVSRERNLAGSCPQNPGRFLQTGLWTRCQRRFISYRRRASGSCKIVFTVGVSDRSKKTVNVDHVDSGVGLDPAEKPFRKNHILIATE